ncbi:putative polysaccharide biosynthesis protein [Rossellomorea marisflavi]|uniref:putative polysaccharide biosynthesis protein n=1 Tax=Rossellomorea marisflavi TaxID=189381 RepID=UPI0040446D85
MDKKMMRGTFFLTSATFISKIIGFLFIIPFTLLVGDTGYALYKYAYGPYTILLSLSTIGLPLAVSKFVAKYNERGNYFAGLNLLRYGLIAMIISGIVSFLLLYFSAPWVVVAFGEGGSGNSREDMIYVVRLVSFALLVVPPMSLLRGYFQGSDSMGPSAMSTVMEQVVRIVFILAGGYLILNVLNGTIKAAVGIATFAAFIGGLASLVLLLWVFWKRRRLIRKQMDESVGNAKIAVFPMFKELTRYAIPFVITGLTIPIYQNIDTFTINRLFMNIGYAFSKVEVINGNIGIAQILVLVPVSLATAFGMTLIPRITSSFESGRIQEVRDSIDQTFQLVLFFTFPAAIGLSAVGTHLFRLMFPSSSDAELGGIILEWYAPAAIIIALFTVTTATMQGINEQKKVVWAIAVGIAVKVVLNILLVPPFKEIGPILATYAGMGVSVLYTLLHIKKAVGFSIRKLIRSLIPIAIVTAIMAAVVLAVEKGVEAAVPSSMGDKGVDLIVTSAGIIAGMVVFIAGSWRLPVVQGILSARKQR